MSIASYAKHFSTTATPQSEPIPGKTMVPNSAGGFGFAVDRWTRLNRWLILGSAGGSYYASEKALTVEDAKCVMECLDEDPARVVRTIVEISDAGRAPKNDPAIFALAMAAGHPKAKAEALAALPRVARTGTHLYQFWAAVKNFRGRGQGLHKAVQAWYDAKSPEQLAYQVGKYQSREGWSHRDVLRLVRPGDKDPAHGAVYRWAVKGKDGLGARTVKRSEKSFEYPDVSAHLPRFLQAVDEARNADKATVVRLIRDDRLPRECVPTERLNDPEVWEALLEEMPLTAMVRNLGKMTAVGLLKPMSAAAKAVADRLGDQEYIRKSRLHPMAILLAAKTYASGHGDKGKLAWQPVSQVNDALDSSFYLAFGNVEPAGKRVLTGLDVSASMTSAYVGGTTLSCAEASAAMAMIQLKTEPQYQLMAFDTGMRPLDISKYSRLSDAVRNTSNINGGGTDCSLPMVLAAQFGWQVDVFQVYTDSETYAGRMHPSQALIQYRQKTGIPARLAVLGMVSNGFSIADPADAGMLDLVGFDAATPAILADFGGSRI